jgi:hypothetical protein
MKKYFFKLVFKPYGLYITIMESNSTTQIPSANGGEKKPVRLVEIEVTNQNEALQLIVTFLNLAQKRGAFTLDESAKLWECVKHFQ